VTVTGQQWAREVFEGEAERVFYFPLDWPWTVRRTLRAIEPSVVLIMETELWPGLLRACRRRKIPTAIVNGRLSEQSFRRYRLVPSFISRVVNCLDLAIMQTDADAERMNVLGLDRDRVFVSGNIKFDAGMSDEHDSLTAELAARFGLQGGPVILAASTHDPEERIIIESFAEILGRHTDDLKLVIAPRHPERFAAVASQLNSSGLRWVRRTAEPTAADAACQVILLDTIGELRSVFPLGCIVFVGGSLAPVGGHNILEPAAVGSCIVTGPHTENFRDIVSTFARANALIQLAEVPGNEVTKTVTSAFEELLSDPEKRRALGEHARSLVLNNRGATTRTMKTLQGILTETANTKQSRSAFVAHQGGQSA
jgi:3-deoxy-D-manno-octulosonic-acid transferase